MIIKCVHKDCNTKFEMIGSIRRCNEHRTKPPKNPRISFINPIKINGKETHYQMLDSDPYRMYLYHLDKMKEENLPVANKHKHRWFNRNNCISNSIKN